MGVFGWCALVTIWVMTIVPGTVAISCGKLLPWTRDHVVSPRKWGVGAITLGLGATIGMTASRTFMLAPVAALCVALCGLGLMGLSTRPGPTSRP
jgi:hypothetical protein